MMVSPMEVFRGGGEASSSSDAVSSPSLYSFSLPSFSLSESPSEAEASVSSSSSSSSSSSDEWSTFRRFDMGDVRRSEVGLVGEGEGECRLSEAMVYEEDMASFFFLTQMLLVSYLIGGGGDVKIVRLQISKTEPFLRELKNFKRNFTLAGSHAPAFLANLRIFRPIN